MVSSDSISLNDSALSGQYLNEPLDAKFDDFFALFEQPVQFDLSQLDLDNRLRQLQKRYHPDNLNSHPDNLNSQDDLQSTSNTTSLPQSSDQTSALINQAYQTLSHADSRAAYLLELVGQSQTLEQSIADLEFLDDAMQLRIDLEDAIDDKARSALQSLHPQITQRLKIQSQRFTEGYQQQKWQQAIDATQKLKFLVKLNADITIALDELASSEQQDDDDLYV